MSDIHVAIRNQADAAMSSINGEQVIVLLTRDRHFYAQQPVTIQTAMALFLDLPAGLYTIIARHSALSPTEVRQDVNLGNGNLFGVRFIYNEPYCQLIRIETELRFF